MSPLLIAFARPPWPWLILFAGVGGSLSASQTVGTALPAFCGEAGARLILGVDGLGVATGAPSWDGGGALLLGWASMLLAMTPPLLAAPLMHIWRSSPSRRRPRSLACFLIAYGGTWFAAAPVLTGAGLVLGLLAGDGAFAVAVTVAATWSASPWQRRSLNRGHRMKRIGVSDGRGDLDCIAFGAAHGGWCVAACWPWMLLPLVAGTWHMPTMAAAAAAMFVDRLTTPTKPCWRIPRAVTIVTRLMPLQARSAGARLD